MHNLNKFIIPLKQILGFGNGHKRTKLIKKNIAASFLIKGLNIAIGLALVPLTINYLNPTKYGIWITLTSLVAWFSFFDIGLGNGLRNRFAEALAKGNHALAKTYVSTTYAILVIIISILLILFNIANIFLDWSIILNTGNNPALKSELSYVALVVFTSFGLNFVLNLISVILSADQRPAKSALFKFLGRFISLLFIYILTKIGSGSLLSLALIYCSISPIVFTIVSFWFFNGKYKSYKPSIKTVDFSKAKDLFSLGLKFFVVQISAVLLYQTNNIIITQLFGPFMVTSYNIAFKYFNVLLMGFIIIVGPFWSAFTEAWVKHDIIWIKSVIRKLVLIWAGLVVVGIIMLLSSSFIFKVWIGDQFVVPFSVIVLTLIWVIINAWNGIFSHFLNGVGKIKLQLYIGITVALINVPLAVYLGKKNGISGVLLANVLLGAFSVWIYPLQYRKIIKNKATGIWNK